MSTKRWSIPEDATVSEILDELDYSSIIEESNT